MILFSTQNAEQNLHPGYLANHTELSREFSFSRYDIVSNMFHTGNIYHHVNQMETSSILLYRMGNQLFIRKVTENKRDHL
jgi:hypothetical protein